MSQVLLKMLRIGLLFVVWATMSLSLSPEALALIGNSERAFGLDGSIRTLFFLVDQDDTLPFSGKNEFDAVNQTILRLTALGKPGDFLAYEFHWVQSVTASSVSLTGGEETFLAARGFPRYRTLDANWDVFTEDSGSSTILLDRFNAKMAFDWGDITLGRQAVTFGKAYFWNPLDVFFPFDASQFDREYKPGVDAVRVDIPLGLFSGVNLVGAGGPCLGIQEGADNEGAPENASWYGSAVLGRVFSNVKGWDFALQAGKIFGGWQTGGGIVGDIGPVQIRGEAAQFLAMKSDDLPFPLEGELVEDGFTGVLGLGHRFDNSFSIDVEYFYNGAGDPDNLNAALVRSQFGSSLQLGRHFLGWLARYEFKPILVGQMAMINSLSDGSFQVQPILIVSLSDEMDLLIGSTLNFGPPPEENRSSLPEFQSEFGSFPNSYFFEWKFYF